MVSTDLGNATKADHDLRGEAEHDIKTGCQLPGPGTLQGIEGHDHRLLDSLIANTFQQTVGGIGFFAAS